MGRKICALCGWLVLLQGCGPSRAGDAHLTMWLVGSEAQAKTIHTVAQAFTERTGIRIQCEAIAWGEAHSKYLTAVAGGVQPDIGTMGLTWGAEFGRLGALVDLRQAFSDELAGIQRQTFPGLWRSIEDRGMVFGIPLDLSIQTLYYRTDLIPTPPSTWEDLVTLLERMRQHDRRMIIDWGSLSWIGYAPFLWQAGGNFYDGERGRATLDSPEAVKALEFFRDLYARHGVPRTSIPVEQGFRTGEFPLAMSGNWKMVSLALGVPEIEGRWGIALMPKGPGGRRTAFLGGRILSIFSRSQHHEEAWRFLQYLFEPKVQAKLYHAGLETQDAYLPPNIGTWDHLRMDPGMKAVLNEQAGDAQGPPVAQGWNETTHLVESAIQRVILHDASAVTELAKANEAMNRALRATEARR